MNATHPVTGHTYRNRRTGVVARADRVFRSGPSLVWDYTVVGGPHSVGCKGQAVVSIGWASAHEEAPSEVRRHFGAHDFGAPYDDDRFRPCRIQGCPVVKEGRSIDEPPRPRR